MAVPTLPEEVLVEFLQALTGTVSGFEETLFPVVRGSFLMRRWFGERARPAGDLDLEAFESESALGPTPQRQRRDGSSGRYGEFESPLDLCKAMCRYAAEGTTNYPSREARSIIEFFELESMRPAEIAAMEAVNFRHRPPPLPGGSSLWTYSTPGERYFTGWRWSDQGQEGQLQIDIAQPRAYALDDLDLAELPLQSVDGSTFSVLGYTPEMLLAAKLSWLMRGLRLVGPRKPGAIEWVGSLKDLFDAHLLLTESELRPAAFQKSLAAIGVEDDLDFQQIDVLLAAAPALPADVYFTEWREFSQRHAERTTRGPAGMLLAISDRLPGLLGDFHRPQDVPFQRAIQADPVDEFQYLAYADWLEERGDASARFLRQFVEVFFHRNDMPEPQAQAARKALQESLKLTSKPWLLRLFGTSERYREMTQRIRDGKL